MPEAPAVVFVIDDDPSMRGALEDLVGSVGLQVRPFASPQDFLQSKLPDAPGCLVLDVRLPGMSGLTFQQELAKLGVALPVIFITGHGDIPMSVRAMKSGAVEFLTKPFREEDLIAAMRQALERDGAAKQRRAELAGVRARMEKLTPREREVLGLVVAGRMNKQIAAELGTAEQTIKQHRGRVMKKLGVDSVAELVRLAERVVPR